MTFPRSDVANAVLLSQPTKVVELLQQLLEETKRQGGFRRGLGGESDRGSTDEGILGVVSTSGGALTDFRVPIGNLKEIYIADWPFELTSLQVKLNDPRNPAIEILRMGRRIKSRFPIKTIFITTPVALSGQIVILDGSIQVSDVPWSLLNPLSFEQRRKHVRIENQSDFDPPEAIGALSQPGLFFVEGTVTAGTTNWFTDIRANHRVRLYGTVTSERAAAPGDITEVQLTWATSPGSVNRNIIDRHAFGPLHSIWQFDVEYFFDTVNGQVEVVVLDIGPAGNILHVSMHAEVHPL